MLKAAVCCAIWALSFAAPAVAQDSLLQKRLALHARHYQSNQPNWQTARALAEHYQQHHNWPMAARYWEKAAYPLQGSTKRRAFYQNAFRCYIFAGYFRQATYLSEHLDTNQKATQKALCLAYWGQGRRSKAQYYFEKLLACQADSLQGHYQAQWERLQSQWEKSNWPSPEAARVFSLLVPGSGQALCGRWQDAAFSLGIVGGFGVLFYTTTVNLSIWHALWFVSPFLTRYYIGGTNNAAEACLQRREKIRGAAFDRLRGLLQALPPCP